MGIVGDLKLGEIVGLALSVLSTILLCASCGGNDWISVGETTQGLWKACNSLGICVDLSDLMEVEPIRHAIRFLSIMAILSGIGSIIGMVMLHLKKITPMREFQSLSTTAAVAFVTVIVFTIKSSPLSEGAGYGWSYVLGWIGGIGYAIAAIAVRVMLKEE